MESANADLTGLLNRPLPGRAIRAGLGRDRPRWAHCDGRRFLRFDGRNPFGIAIRRVAECLNIPPDTDLARRRADVLWSLVRGHSFLVIASGSGDPEHRVIDLR